MSKIGHMYSIFKTKRKIAYCSGMMTDCTWPNYCVPEQESLSCFEFDLSLAELSSTH